MAIPEGKKRIAITLEIDLVEKIQEIAKRNRRNVSDQIAILIEKYVQEEK